MVDADYDGAVRAARSDADGADGGLLIQDTAWAGYEEIPSWIVDGYETLFAEIDAQLSAAGVSAVDLVSVQVGVGSLAQAAVAHYRSSALAASTPPPRLLSSSRTRPRACSAAWPTARWSRSRPTSP